MEQQNFTQLQPDIWLGGVRFTEPVIAATSVLISFVCLYIWLRLGRKGFSSRFAQLMRLFFLLMGTSTLIGGLIGHAFLYRFSFLWKMPGWTLGMVATTIFAQAAIAQAHAAISPLWGRVLTILNWGGLMLGAAVLWTNLNFHLVEVHVAYDLVILVGTLQSYCYLRTRNPASGWLLAGIGMATLSVIPHLMKYSFSPWFTYFDIGHFLICGALWMFMWAVESEAPAGA